MVIAIDVTSLVIGTRSLPTKKPYYGYYYVDGPFGEISLEFAAFIAVCCVVAIALWATLGVLNRWRKTSRERRHSSAQRLETFSSITWPERYRILHLALLYVSLTLALTGPIYIEDRGEMSFFIPRFTLAISTTDLFGLTTTFASLGAAFLLWRSGVRISSSAQRNRPSITPNEPADQMLNNLFATAEAIEREIVEMKGRLTDSLEMLTVGTRRVETELRVRRAKLEELATEARQYEQTAKLHKETSDAVRDFLTAKVSEQLNAIDRSSRRSQIIFFFVGVLVSIPIGVAINLATK